MDQESNQMEQHPVLCRNGCGFYSNHGTDGLCSVCYKDMIKKKQQLPQQLTAPAPGAMASLSIDESSSSSSSSSSPAKTSVDTALPTVILPSSQTDKRNEIELGGMAIANLLGDNDKNISASPSSSINTDCDSEGHKEGGKKKKNRCMSCKKKVGLTGFDCRCGGLFCSIHRYSDKHECTFDYKELGAEEIRKSNPVVVASKVQKI